ncbi:MAG TPA: helicase, partial [Sphingomicrobium sp.]
ERRLGDELERRANALVEAADETFELVVEEGGGVAVAWSGHVLARLAAGRSLLEPALRTARALDRLSAQSRAALRSRLERWLDAQVDAHLRPLEKLAAAATDPASSPGVRALAAMLADSGGVLPRKAVLGAISHLEQRDRHALHRLRVRLGPLDVFLPALLKPAAQHWRAALLAVRSGAPMPLLPAAGAATLGPDSDPRGAALAYRRLGRQWIRIDLADRLASHARQVRSAGGDNPVDVELATSVGLDEEAIGRLMAEVGFTRAGEAWKWRGRRPPREDRSAAPSHAFAELAKLKKK